MAKKIKTFKRKLSLAYQLQVKALRLKLNTRALLFEDDSKKLLFNIVFKTGQLRFYSVNHLLQETDIIIIDRDLQSIKNMLNTDILKNDWLKYFIELNKDN